MQMSEDPWFKVKAFLEAWYRPLEESDGYRMAVLNQTEKRLSQLPIPIRVREWYLLVGKLAHGFPNEESLRRIFSLEELYMEGGLVFFYTLEAAEQRWGFEMRGDDPMVFGQSGTSERRECGAFSEFALTMIANEIVETPSFPSAWGSSSDPRFMPSALGFIPMGETTMDDNGTSQFWFQRGVVLKVTTHDGDSLHRLINLTAKNEMLLDNIVAALFPVLDSVMTG